MEPKIMTATEFNKRDEGVMQRSLGLGGLKPLREDNVNTEFLTERSKLRINASMTVNIAICPEPGREKPPAQLTRYSGTK
jgi:hypothetical protein